MLFLVDEVCSRKIQTILGEELPQLAKCLKRIENIRRYVGEFRFHIVFLFCYRFSAKKKKRFSWLVMESRGIRGTT